MAGRADTADAQSDAGRAAPTPGRRHGTRSRRGRTTTAPLATLFARLGLRDLGFGRRSGVRPSAGRATDRSVLVTRVAALCMLGGLFTIVLRVAQLQILPGHALIAHSPELNSSRPEMARRGDLRDRRGRVLATSRLGYRLFVDPTAVNPKEFASLTALTDGLARLTGDDPQVLRRRLGALADHPVGRDAGRILAERAAASQSQTVVADGEGPSPLATAASSGEDAKAGPPSPVQYLPLIWLLDPDQVDVIRAAQQEGRFRGVGLQPLLVRHRPQQDLAAPLVGIVGFDGDGLTGMERHFNRELKEEPGSLTYLRDNRLRTLWLNVSDYSPPAAGRDVHLSIDLEIQRIAEEALQERVKAYNAGGGRLLVLDPQTGELLAVADYLNPGRTDIEPYTEDPGREKNPALGRPRWLTDPYEPGSTFKPFVWAAATELGTVRPEDVFDCHQGLYRTTRGRRIRDAHPYGELSWEMVLVKSSNIGMAQAAERMTERQLQRAVRDFGFGAPTGIGLPGETSGIVTAAKDWTHYTQTSVSMGHEIAVTPLQMVQAFSAFCRDGTIPLIRIVASPDLFPVPVQDNRWKSEPANANVAWEDDGDSDLTSTAATTGARRGFTPAMQLSGSSRERFSSGSGTPRLPAGRDGAFTDAPTRGPMPGEIEGQVMGGPNAAPAALLERRALSREVALQTRAVMRRVMLEGTGRKANEGARYRMFGKSGTAELPNPKGGGYFKDRYICSFIGAAPLDHPRLVVLCVIEDPDRRIGHFGGVVAGPVVRDVLNETLAYLGVPTDLHLDNPDRKSVV